MRMSVIPAWLAAVLAVGGLLTACSDSGPQPAEGPPVVPEPVAKKKASAPGDLPEVRYYVLGKSCPYCKDINTVIEGGDAAAEGADEPLTKVYDGRVKFVIKPAFDAEFDPDPDMEAYEFGGAGHGMAGVGPDGAVLFSLPGHHFGRGQIVSKVEEMLRKLGQ